MFGLWAFVDNGGGEGAVGAVLLVAVPDAGLAAAGGVAEQRHGDAVAERREWRSAAPRVRKASSFYRADGS
ncbi:hypothetical protein OG894_45180 (plasmid) [Streptomyces sp. NBC_01724]|uniref:hypothetical protein n=1 Tax=Streptomyces sp. NBC_01724 TaxID=2975922 RepID=UPI002E3443A4|nr:hypothetical protein [Streptomyces sp. NBC_01724]